MYEESGILYSGSEQITLPVCPASVPSHVFYGAMTPAQRATLDAWRNEKSAVVAAFKQRPSCGFAQEQIADILWSNQAQPEPATGCYAVATKVPPNEKGYILEAWFVDAAGQFWHVAAEGSGFVTGSRQFTRYNVDGPHAAPAFTGLAHSAW